jgi:hypothetical protein
VRIVVTPPELNINPVLGGHSTVVGVFGLMDEGRPGDLPLELSEEQDVSAGGVHLVRLTRVDGFFLHGLDF